MFVYDENVQDVQQPFAELIDTETAVVVVMRHTAERAVKQLEIFWLPDPEPRFIIEDADEATREWVYIHDQVRAQRPIVADMMAKWV